MDCPSVRRTDVFDGPDTARDPSGGEKVSVVDGPEVVPDPDGSVNGSSIFSKKKNCIHREKLQILNLELTNLLR